MNFYVYAYLRKKDKTPYYIGKGTGDRMHKAHLNLNIPPNIENRVIIKDGLSENEAFETEKFFIKYYGRKDLGSGTLLNKTDGGAAATLLHIEYTLLCLLRLRKN